MAGRGGGCDVSVAGLRVVAAPRGGDRSRLRASGTLRRARARAADALERVDEVGEERVAGGEAQHEPSAGAADRGGDGDEAEAEAFRVAGASRSGRASSFSQASRLKASSVQSR